MVCVCVRERESVCVCVLNKTIVVVKSCCRLTLAELKALLKVGKSELMHCDKDSDFIKNIDLMFVPLSLCQSPPPSLFNTHRHTHAHTHTHTHKARQVFLWQSSI